MAKKQAKKATKKKTTKKTAGKKPVKQLVKKAKAAVKKLAKKAPAAPKAVKKLAKKSPVKAIKKAAAKVVEKIVPKKAAPKKAGGKSAPTSTAKKIAIGAGVTAAVAGAAVAAGAAMKKAASAAAAAVGPGDHPLIGTKLPALSLLSNLGTSVDLASLSEGKVVLYFYPKDDTPGCTTEACGFRDNFNRAETAGIKVIGVSPDSVESHQKFIDKYSINFDLLSDEGHKLADELKVWKEKNFMGKTYMGIERSTFLLNNGEIVKAWQPVKVEGHVDEVLAAAEQLS